MQTRLSVPTRFVALLAAASAALLTARPASAAIIGYDFEANPVSSSPVITSTVSGVTLTLSRNGGANLDVVDLTGIAPVSFGSRTIGSFADTATSTAYVIGNLSSAFSSLSLQFGDFGADSDLVTLTGFSGPNGTGTQLATASVNYGTTSFPTPGIILNAAAGMQSFTLSSVGTGTTSNFNSLFYDDFTFTTTIPEPASCAVIGLGLAAGLRRRRRPC